jgi:hypothetical protein
LINQTTQFQQAVFEQGASGPHQADAPILEGLNGLQRHIQQDALLVP